MYAAITAAVASSCFDLRDLREARKEINNSLIQPTLLPQPIEHLLKTTSYMHSGIKKSLNFKIQKTS